MLRWSNAPFTRTRRILHRNHLTNVNIERRRDEKRGAKKPVRRPRRIDKSHRPPTDSARRIHKATKDVSCDVALLLYLERKMKSSLKFYFREAILFFSKQLVKCALKKSKASDSHRNRVNCLTHDPGGEPPKYTPLIFLPATPKKLMMFEILRERTY